MNSVEVLQALLESHLYTFRDVRNTTGLIDNKTKALEDAIEALRKSGQVGRIREYISSESKVIGEIVSRNALTEHGQGRSLALFEVSNFIDSLQEQS